MKACIRPIRSPCHMTVFYRIVVDVIHVTLIVTHITDDVFPKTSLPNASFSLLQTPG
jgi:hypothetical protein